jgi:hypothetical protein
MSLASKSNLQMLTDDLPNEGGALNENMIRKTHEIIREMTEMQKYEKAKAHIFDALNYKHPRH